MHCLGFAALAVALPIVLKSQRSTQFTNSLKTAARLFQECYFCRMTRGRFVCHARHFTARSTIILPKSQHSAQLTDTATGFLLNLSDQLISLVYKQFSRFGRYSGF